MATKPGVLPTGTVPATAGIGTLVAICSGCGAGAVAGGGNTTADCDGVVVEGADDPPPRVSRYAADPRSSRSTATPAVMMRPRRRGSGSGCDGPSGPDPTGGMGAKVVPLRRSGGS